MLIFLKDTHPYLEAMDVFVTDNRCRWRDFHTVKQERYCADNASARRLAFILKAKTLVVDMDAIGGCDWEAIAYWETQGATPGDYMTRTSIS